MRLKFTQSFCPCSHPLNFTVGQKVRNLASIFGSEALWLRNGSTWHRKSEACVVGKLDNCCKINLDISPNLPLIYTVTWFWHWRRPSPHYTSSTILGGPRFQEGTRSAKDKLERYSQERSARNGTYLGRGGGGSSQQTRMASEYGPIRSRGSGINQVKSSQGALLSNWAT